MITHITVRCDGRIGEQVTCPRRQLTGADTAEAARSEAVEAGWSCDDERNLDYCPAHQEWS